MLSNQPDHREGKVYCPVHRVYNTDTCPWCTIVPVQVVPAPSVMTEEDKALLRGMNIDPER